MNTSIKFKLAIATGAFMLAILAVIALPATTNACDYGCGYSYAPRPYTYNISYNQYVDTRPVVIQPPPVYVPPPVIQPVYIQQPVVQPVYVQPQPVIQPVYVQPQPIIQPVYQQPVYQAPRLDIGCYVDPGNSRVGQPVTWSAEVTGGYGPYTYSWSGSEGLYGNQPSVIKFYQTSGTKSAIVTVTSANGLTASRACSNAATVTSGTTYRAPAPVVKAPVKAPANDQSAASIFSLSNVPWGWVAILIILVLFVTVMYLLLNKQKI